MLRRPSEDSQLLGRPDKVGERFYAHLLHDMTAMNLNRFFGGAELLSDLLIEPCAQQAGCAIEINCAVYNVQKILFTKWLAQKVQWSSMLVSTH